jgi:hypothetical protein
VTNFFLFFFSFSSLFATLLSLKTSPVNQPPFFSSPFVTFSSMAHAPESQTMVELTPGEEPSPQLKAKEKAPSEIDLSTLSPQDREFYEKYGRLPNTAALKLQKEVHRKQFDSAEYFMQAEKAKAGAAAGGPPPKNLPPHMRKKVPPHLR